MHAFIHLFIHGMKCIESLRSMEFCIYSNPFHHTNPFHTIFQLKSNATDRRLLLNWWKEIDRLARYLSRTPRTSYQRFFFFFLKFCYQFFQMFYINLVKNYIGLGNLIWFHCSVCSIFFRSWHFFFQFFYLQDCFNSLGIFFLFFTSALYFDTVFFVFRDIGGARMCWNITT